MKLLVEPFLTLGNDDAGLVHDALLPSRTTPFVGEMRDGSGADRLGEELQRLLREDDHVLDPVRLARFDRQRALDCAADGDAGVARRIAVAVCGRAGGAALRDAPGRSQTLTDRAGSEESVGLGRGTDSLQSRIWNLHEPAARLDRVDDRAA